MACTTNSEIEWLSSQTSDKFWASAGNIQINLVPTANNLRSQMLYGSKKLQNSLINIAD